MSRERVLLIQSLGAEVVSVSRADGGFLGSIARADEFARRAGAHVLLASGRAPLSMAGVADRLDLPRETLAGLAPARTRGTGGAAPPATPRLLEAGLQRERDLLAAVVRNPSLLDELAALTPEHFDDPLHRRFREAVVSGGPEDEALVALRAELGARADRDEIDERTGKELMLRLHERRLRRELQGAGADLVRATELQARLTKVHSALAELV